MTEHEATEVQSAVFRAHRALNESHQLTASLDKDLNSAYHAMWLITRHGRPYIHA